MKKVILFVISSLIFASSYGQPEEVLKLMNEARTKPQDFLEARLLPYLKKHTLEENSYAKSLIEELKNRNPVGELKSSSALTKSAREHAMDMGSTNKVGHNSSDGISFADRVRKKIKTGMIAENCDYGNEAAIDIVMSLLIDDGISNLGHRKNILYPGLNWVGIAIEKHKTYGMNCVMDFSQNDH